MTQPRTIAIGDIHGCSAALDALLDRIEPTQLDTIVTLGDYVDRGPDTRAVIDRLIALSSECDLIPLIGNHEVMMLDGIEQGGDPLQWWLTCGGRETMASYGNSTQDVPDSHVAFLRDLKEFHETERYIFVHANYDHDLPFADQSRDVTLWRHMHIFEPPEHNSGKTVFVGHTPQRQGDILDLGHLVCIDTACAVGGWLTAIDVDSRQIWQANKDGKFRTRD